MVPFFVGQMMIHQFRGTQWVSREAGEVLLDPILFSRPRYVSLLSVDSLGLGQDLEQTHLFW